METIKLECELSSMFDASRNIDEIVQYLESTESNEVDTAIIKLLGKELTSLEPSISFDNKQECIDTLKVINESFSAGKVLKAIWNAIVKFIKAIYKYIKEALYGKDKVIKDVEKTVKLLEKSEPELTVEPLEETIVLPESRIAYKYEQCVKFSKFSGNVNDIVDILKMMISEIESGKAVRELDLSRLNIIEMQFGYETKFGSNYKSEDQYQGYEFDPYPYADKTLKDYGFTLETLRSLPDTLSKIYSTIDTVNNALANVKKILDGYKQNREVLELGQVVLTLLNRINAKGMYIVKSIQGVNTILKAE